MLSKSDLDAPARLAYVAQGAKVEEGGVDWASGHDLPTLREALHRAVSEEPPPARHAVIRTQSGVVIKPDDLDVLWDSVQGP